MKGLNKLMVIGNLGGDPEVRYTTNARPMASFRVAVNERLGEKERTEWFTVVAWGKLAEVCTQYLSKGSRVYLEGRLQTRNYQDADGRERQRTELVLREMVMLGGGRPRSQQAQQAEEVDVDELPF